MNIKEFLRLKHRLFKKSDQINIRKGHDYAGTEDTLKNFKLVEFLDVMPAELGCYLRLCDKISRIAQYLRTGVLKVEEESLEDTVVDAINYLCLFYALIEEKKRENAEFTVIDRNKLKQLLKDFPETALIGWASNPEMADKFNKWRERLEKELLKNE